MARLIARQKRKKDFPTVWITNMQAFSSLASDRGTRRYLSLKRSVRGWEALARALSGYGGIGSGYSSGRPALPGMRFRGRGGLADVWIVQLHPGHQGGGAGAAAGAGCRRGRDRAARRGAGAARDPGSDVTALRARLASEADPGGPLRERDGRGADRKSVVEG